MHWVAHSQKHTAAVTLDKPLWDSAAKFRATSVLEAQEFSGPVPAIIFLRFAEVPFALQRAKLEKASASSRPGSRVEEPAAYHAENILNLPPPDASFPFLLKLREVADIGARVNEAMRDIEEHNPQLPSVLPKPYNIFTNPLLKALFERTSETPATLDYDALGRIYEHFLAELARTEGRIGGKFHTSSCIVRIFNEITAHYHGSIVEILPLADRRRAKSRMNRAKSLCARGRRRLCIRSSSGRLSLAPESLHSGKPSSLQS